MVEFSFHVDRFVFDLLLALGRADVHADAAAGAVVGGYLNGEQMIGEFLARVLLGLQLGRQAGERAREDLHADGGMRADQGTSATVDADGRIPDRDLVGQRPLLPTSRPGGKGSVDRKGADRKKITLPGQKG